MRTQRSTWTTRLSRCEEGRELRWREEIRFRSSWAWQESRAWHVGIWRRGLQIEEKPPGYTETSSRTVRSPVSRFLTGPLEHHLGTDRTSTFLGVDERDKLGEDDSLGPHLVSEGFTQTQVGQQVGV